MHKTCVTHQIRLLADIGATNARFQTCVNGERQGEPVVLATAAFADAISMLELALEALSLTAVDSAVLAIAGPAHAGNQITVTNTGLQFTIAEVGDVLGGDVKLVNDFFALASGVPHFQSLHRLGGGEIEHGPKAVLGPGSGLGMAALIPLAPQRWHVVASEGGHADLAPGNPLEAELWSILGRSNAQVSWETVLSGTGLVRLYGAMSELWGSRPEPLSALDISRQGVDMQDPVCHQTLETFCALLGAAAGNLALTVCATGGVYIAGGIVPHLLDFVDASPLRRRFEECGDLAGYTRSIPVFVVTDANPGLLGAMYC